LRECLRSAAVKFIACLSSVAKTDDFQINLARPSIPAVDIHFIQEESSFHTLLQETVIIDALLAPLTRRGKIYGQTIDHIMWRVSNC
jgi:hypothetical protein